MIDSFMYFIGGNDFLWSISLYGELILFSILIFVLCKNYTLIRKFFISNFNKYDYLNIIILFCFGFLIRLYFMDYSHTNIYDELLYIQHSRELIENGKILTPIRSIGWPFILAIPFLVFGISSYVGFIFSAIIGTISIVLFYIIMKLLLDKRNISFFTALFFSILPFNIFWSTKMETNISSLFMILLSILFFIFFQKTKNIHIFYLSIILTFFSTTFRGENIIVLLVTLFFLSFLNYRLIYKNINNFLNFFFISLISFFLVLPNYLNQYFFTNSQDWSYGEKINVLNNITYFIDGFLDNHLFLYYDLITIVGVLYFIFLLIKKKINIKLYLLFLLPFFLLIGVYNLIWLKYVSGVDRLYMEVYPIYILFFGFGILFIYENCYGFLKKTFLRIICSFLIMSLIILNILNINGYMENTNYKKLQTLVSNDFINVKNNSCIYIIFDNEYYSAFNNFKYTFSYEFLNNKILQKNIFNNFSCIALIDDKYCYDNSYGEIFIGPDGKTSVESCNMIKNLFSLKKIKTYNLDGLKYGIYQIKGKK